MPAVMNADFEIAIDRSRNLLDVRMSGFFGVDDVRRYQAAIADATHSLGGDPGAQHMINDITGMRIQAQDIVSAFAGFMADRRYAARPIAFIVDSTLARMQVERAMGDRRARLFKTRAEAETWLFDDQRSAA